MWLFKGPSGLCQGEATGVGQTSYGCYDRCYRSNTEEGKEGLEDFKVFVRFVEAVVAYHRFYGGED